MAISIAHPSNRILRLRPKHGHLGMDAGALQSIAAPGLIVTRRLHRMVQHGYGPWLDYDVASGSDRVIHLRYRSNMATLGPDGTVTFTAQVRIPPISTARPGSLGSSLLVITGEDVAFPANTPNRRNLVRRPAAGQCHKSPDGDERERRGRHTNIVAHAGWFFSDGYRTLVVDLDQQANLTPTLGAHLSTVESVELSSPAPRASASGRRGRVPASP